MNTEQLRPSTHARWLARETIECIESRICQLLLKTRGSSEAVLEQEDISKVVQCFSYSIASFVPLVFNTQPTKSGLHTFPLRRQIACQPASGRNYSIFIYFCSRRSYVYGWNRADDLFAALTLLFVISPHYYVVQIESTSCCQAVSSLLEKSRLPGCRGKQITNLRAKLKTKILSIQLQANYYSLPVLLVSVLSFEWVTCNAGNRHTHTITVCFCGSTPRHNNRKEFGHNSPTAEIVGFCAVGKRCLGYGKLGTLSSIPHLLLAR